MATKRTRTKAVKPAAEQAPPPADEPAPPPRPDTRALWRAYHAAIRAGQGIEDARAALVTACTTKTKRTRYADLTLGQLLARYEHRGWKTDQQREELKAAIEHLAAGGR